MMQRNSEYLYDEIRSFEDFRMEKQRLILKGRLAEAKINMEIIRIREIFSVTNLVISFAKDYILPKFSSIFEDILGFSPGKGE